MEKQDACKEYTKFYQEKVEYKRKRSETHKMQLQKTRKEEAKRFCGIPEYKSGIGIQDILNDEKYSGTNSDIVAPHSFNLEKQTCKCGSLLHRYTSHKSCKLFIPKKQKMINNDV
jgi:hypothetical protein